MFSSTLQGRRDGVCFFWIFFWEEGWGGARLRYPRSIVYSLFVRLFKIHLENKRPLLKGDIAAGESQEVQFPKQKVIALQGIKIFKQIPPWESRVGICDPSRRVRFPLPLVLKTSREGLSSCRRHRCINHATAPGALCDYGFGDVAWCLIRWTTPIGERDFPSILAIFGGYYQMGRPLLRVVTDRFSASMSGDEILLLEALHAVEA